MKPRVASFFAGIGGFDIGFERAGFESCVQVEIDKACRDILEKHFPNALRLDDVRAIPAIIRRLKRGKEVHVHWISIINALRACLVFTGGFPRQDVSVAGQRAGLAGERSGLWFVFRRIIALFRPAWVVIENVPGLLSSNRGRDLAVILRGLSKLGYRWAYRVLDAQYHGVAQRRERVFIVASLGDYRCAEVLFERDSVSWDTPPSREPREAVAGTINAGAHPSGFNGQDAHSGRVVTGTLSSRSEGGGGLGTDFELDGGLTASAFGGNRQSGPLDVATACNAHPSRHDFETETFIAFQQQGSEPRLGIGAQRASMGKSSHTGGVPMVAFRACGQDGFTPSEVSPPLASTDGGGAGVPTVAAYRTTGNDGAYELGDKTGALGTGTDPNHHVIAFSGRERGDDGRGYDRPPQTMEDHTGAIDTMKPWNIAVEVVDPGVALPLTSRVDRGGSHREAHGNNLVAGRMYVRRLTPRECERLQAFPDDSTLHRPDDTEQSDSARYKQLGNAVCVNVAEWVARRLMKVIL